MNWKFILVSIVLMAIAMIGLRSLLFGEFDGRMVVESVVTAIITSVLFDTLGFKLARNSAQKMLKTVPEATLGSEEELLLTAGASHYKGAEAVGGRLTLTNRRLIFQSHRFNVQNHEQEISISNIKAVVQGDGILKKTFTLELANNERHRFLVNSPSAWIKAMQH